MIPRCEKYPLTCETMAVWCLSGTNHPELNIAQVYRLLDANAAHLYLLSRRPSSVANHRSLSARAFPAIRVDSAMQYYTTYAQKCVRYVRA
jgi:hypothetical protein